MLVMVGGGGEGDGGVEALLCGMEGGRSHSPAGMKG